MNEAQVLFAEVRSAFERRGFRPPVRMLFEEQAYEALAKRVDELFGTPGYPHKRSFRVENIRVEMDRRSLCLGGIGIGKERSLREDRPCRRCALFLTGASIRACLPCLESPDKSGFSGVKE